MNSGDSLPVSLAGLIKDGKGADLPAPADAEPMVSTSIRLPLALLEWARTEAIRRGLPSWSALVRQLLEDEQPTTDATPTS